MAEGDFYLPKYQGYVHLKHSQLPETVTFDVHGAAAPLEEREKEQRRAQALQQAIAIEIQKRQLMAQGLEPEDTKQLDLTKLQEVILREGFSDVDQFFTEVPGGLPGATGDGAVVPGADPGDAEGQITALLAGQGV